MDDAALDRLEASLLSVRRATTDSSAWEIAWANLYALRELRREHAEQKAEIERLTRLANELPTALIR
jgi:hypothetical protein